MKALFRRSLRVRLSLYTGLILFGLGNALFVYFLLLPHWLVTRSLSQELRLYSVSSHPSPQPRGDAALYPEGSFLVVTRSTLQSRSFFWLYGLGGMVLFTSLAVLLTYVVTKRAFRPLYQLRNVVARLSPKALPSQLPLFSSDEEIVALTQAYNLMLNKVHQTLQAHNQFVADAAHELRSPLATLRIQIATLSQWHQLNPQERRQILQDIQDMLQQMERTVSSLLLLLHEPDVRFAETVDLAHLTKQVIDEFQKQARHLGIHLSKDIDETPALVKGYRPLLRVVLRNLIENALLYNDPGGSVTVHTRVLPRYVLLQICDTGWGISPDELPYIFERFYRGQKAQRKPGSGLGLAVVKRVVTLHQGHIEIMSEPGKGSCFRLRLPRLQDSGLTGT